MKFTKTKKPLTFVNGYNQNTNSKLVERLYMETTFSKPKIAPDFYCSRCDMYLTVERKSKRDFLCCVSCEKKIIRAEQSVRDEPARTRAVAEHVKTLKDRINERAYQVELAAIDSDELFRL